MAMPRNGDVKLNMDVIERISRFLSFGDLKNLRLIDKIWSKSVTLRFYKQAVLILTIDPTCRKSLEEFEAEMSDPENIQKPRTVKVIISGTPPAMFIPTIWKSGLKAKQLEELASKEMDPFKNIIRRFSSNLEELRIDFSGQHSYHSDLNFSSIFHPDVEFPKLRKLHLWTRLLDKKLDKITATNFYTSLYKSAPSIQEVSIEDLEEGSTFLACLLDPESGARDYSLLPRLNSIIVNEYCSGKGVRFLSNFPQTFQTLDLHCLTLNFLNSKTFGWLGELLEKNSNSLQNLSFRKFIAKEVGKPIVGLKMPIFCRLKSLQIELVDGELEILFDGNGILKYARNFPVLKSLDIRFDFGYKRLQSVPCMGKVYGIFFPRESKEVVQSVWEVRLPSSGCLCETCQNCDEDCIQRMFPNASIRFHSQFA